CITFYYTAEEITSACHFYSLMTLKNPGCPQEYGPTRSPYYWKGRLHCFISSVGFGLEVFKGPIILPHQARISWRMNNKYEIPKQTSVAAIIAVIFGQTSSRLCPSGSVDGIVPVTSAKLNAPRLLIDGVSKIVVSSLNRKPGENLDISNERDSTAGCLFNSAFAIKLTSMV